MRASSHCLQHARDPVDIDIDLEPDRAAGGAGYRGPHAVSPGADGGGPVREPRNTQPAQPLASVLVLGRREGAHDPGTRRQRGIPVNVPEAWICDTIHGGGDGEGPFTYEFTGLPSWLIPHVDKTSSQYDGLLYGTPTEVKTYTFVVTVTDHAVEPAAKASAVITIDVKPTVTEFTGGEWEGGEAGVLGALAIEGTGLDGTRCTLAPTVAGLAVPSWIESVEVPNGCVVLGKPTT